MRRAHYITCTVWIQAGRALLHYYSPPRALPPSSTNWLKAIQFFFEVHVCGVKATWTQLTCLHTDSVESSLMYALHLLFFVIHSYNLAVLCTFINTFSFIVYRYSLVSVLKLLAVFRALLFLFTTSAAFIFYPRSDKIKAH